MWAVCLLLCVTAQIEVQLFPTYMKVGRRSKPPNKTLLAVIPLLLRRGNFLLNPPDPQGGVLTLIDARTEAEKGRYDLGGLSGSSVGHHESSDKKTPKSGRHCTHNNVSRGLCAWRVLWRHDSRHTTSQDDVVVDVTIIVVPPTRLSATGGPMIAATDDNDRLSIDCLTIWGT